MSQVLSLSRREPLSDFKGIAKTLSEQSDGGRLWWRRRLWTVGERFYNVSLGANASLAHEAASVLREYYDFE